MFIQNPDRTHHVEGGKPNILYNGSQFQIIDHELAFSFLADIIPSPTPWKLRELPFVKKHVFYATLTNYAENHKLSFESFLSRVKSISDPFLDETMSAVPEDWHNPSNAGKIMSYITTIRDNLSQFERGLLEALV